MNQTESEIRISLTIFFKILVVRDDLK